MQQYINAGDARQRGQRAEWLSGRLFYHFIFHWNNFGIVSATSTYYSHVENNYANEVETISVFCFSFISECADVWKKLKQNCLIYVLFDDGRRALSQIHNTDADATQLSSWVASASAVCITGLNSRREEFCDNVCTGYWLIRQSDIISDVKSSRPKWPRGQNFGLGLGVEVLASSWPRSRCLIM